MQAAENYTLEKRSHTLETESLLKEPNGSWF